MNPLNGFGKIEACDNCHEYVAVMHIFKGDKNMKLCIGCAYKLGMAQDNSDIAKTFAAMGITKENADMFNTRLEDVQELFPDGDMTEAMQETFGTNDENKIKGMISDLKKRLTQKVDDKSLDNSNANSSDLEKRMDALYEKLHGSENVNKAVDSDETIDDSDPNDSNSLFANFPFFNTKKSKSDTNSAPQIKNLKKYALNLNEQVRLGKIDEMIGRKDELNRLIQILNRRSKNNPVLLGEPGVGKTALAEGLACAIENGEVPGKLATFDVYLLDMTALVAGTQFRGQFENRLKGVVDELKRLGNVILVIDELHNIMGAGNSEGAMNAANILKPALARGEIRIIGSTTLAEYRKSIEKDTALERRFQPIIISEPNKEDTLAMLYSKRKYLENYHYVTYSDAILQTTVDLADRYITNRFFPDKAIDILDEAGSQANLNNTSLNIYQAAYKDCEYLKEKISEIEDLISESRELVEKERAKQDEQKAASAEAEINEMYATLAQLKAELAQEEAVKAEAEKEMTRTVISFADIAAVIEQWTHIPVKEISESETDRLLHLADRLSTKVIGQKEAILALSQAIKRKRLGLGKIDKPSSFIFVGPTGVGKTELVKTLAEAMFGRKDAYIRLDMSEYMESHTVSKLIGSPPGYVGYEDAGQLTEKVRRNPYSVILLDEIEKAHQDVFNILLQILDEGRLTDSQGRLVNFSNTIIVMTSNAGTSLKQAAFGFNPDAYSSMEQKVLSALRELFKPEFLNRLDEIIVFRQLKMPEIRQIIDLMLNELNSYLAKRQMQLELSDTSKNLLAVLGYDEQYGARPLRRVITRFIEDKLADFYLLNKLDHVAKLEVTLPKTKENLAIDCAQLQKLTHAELKELANQLQFIADGQIISV